jgi:hypothetical protein
MNKLAFSSLINSFVWISETIRVVWFSVKFPSFHCISAFLIVVSIGRKMYLYINKGQFEKEQCYFQR